MTKLHIYALAISGAVLLACVLSRVCGADNMKSVEEYSKYIAIATFAHAGASHGMMRKKKKKPKVTP